MGKGPDQQVGSGLRQTEGGDEGNDGGLGGDADSASARPGKMVRSMPIIPPTNMLVATNRAI